MGLWGHDRDQGKWKAGAEASEEEGREDCDDTFPRGREKCKKACTTMEDGEDDDDTKEVFGVLRVMAEEQHDTLGMLT